MTTPREGRCAATGRPQARPAPQRGAIIPLSPIAWLGGAKTAGETATGRPQARPAPRRGAIPPSP